MKKTILIIGGGYGGLQVAKLIKHKFAQIILIDKTPYHYWQARAHEYISCSIGDKSITSSILQECLDAGVRFIQDEVTSINFDEQNIGLKNHQSMSYDYIILAQGMKTSLFDKIKGLKEYTLDIKVFEDVRKYRDKFDLFLHEKKHRNIVVAGGGLSGVEIALEMAHKVKKRGLLEYFSFSIIEPMDTLLQGLNPYIIKQTHKVVHKHNVKIYKAFVEEVHKEHISLSNGENIEYDLFLFTAGVQVNPISNNKDIEVNDMGQYIVDEYLQINNTKNAFGVGDCVQNVLKDKTMPPTAQIALVNAGYVAKNINRLLKSKPMISAPQKTQGVVVALGGKSAAGTIGDKWGISLKGVMAYAIKKMSHIMSD